MRTHPLIEMRETTTKTTTTKAKTTITVCFFSTVTKDDGITRLNDLILTLAINSFEEYCLAFAV